MTVHAVSPLFVGRARELAVLRDALGEARAGVSATVLVGGEAGVGKTRLLGEFADRADDALVLVGGCLELGTEGLPFAPFTAVLRGLVRRLGRDGVAALVPGGATSGLARLLPEFGEPGREGAEARARLFELVLGLLERLAEERPVALVIEDAHWADRSTRDLLSFLVRYQRTAGRLLLVVTYRSDELHRTHPLRPMLAELGRVEWVTRVELRRLTRREAVAQAASILERRPADADMDLIYARSEGNPLFVEALLSEGGGRGDLPESLRDLLLARVERLPEETQELLRVASAGGQRLEHDLLSAVAGLDDNALSRALRPAVAGNVLVVDGEGYSFRHALIREALHDDLLPGEHTRLHTRYAEALERDPSILPAPRGAIELAHHWHAAHDSTWALVSAWRAAEAARTSTAYDEQLRMLSRVLELWDQVPDAAGRIGADRLEVLRQTTVVAHLAGEYERSIALAGALLAELDPETDPVRTAVVLRQRGLTRYDLGRPGHLDDLRRAAALVPAEPPTRLRAQVLESLSRMLFRPEDKDEKIATAEIAREIARAVGDVNVEANSLITATWARYRFHEVEAQMEAFAEARRIAAAADAYNALMRCAISESDALEGAGWHERAAEVARAGIADSAHYGLARTSGTFLAINLAEPLVSLGRWDEALEVIEQALDLTPPAPYRASLQGFVTDIALARGQLDRAEQLFDASRGVLARGTFRDQTLLPHLRRKVELLEARGQAGEAVREVAEALAERDLVSSPRYVWQLLVTFAHLLTAAAAAAAGGRAAPGRASVAEEAAASLPRLREVARRIGTEGELQEAQRLTFEALLGPEPPVAGVEALRRSESPGGGTEALLGAQPPVAGADTRLGAGASADDAEARVGWRVKAWEAAVGAWVDLGQPYPEARALLGSAQALLAAGDRQEAAARLERARELAARLGAAPLLEQLDVVRRRARLGGGAADEPTGDGQPLGLTARELEVLREVTNGRSNREIAEALVISVKTVSVHVSNILAKLGVAGRGEAAATAHRLHLFDDLP
ncbi:AAA family ATPase [Nonomuraea wenchangensis]